MFASPAGSLAAAAVVLQPASDPAEDVPVLAFQMPAIEGHERLSASLEAYAESAGVDLDVHLYDPATFGLSQLGRRSKEVLETTEADDVLWLVPSPLPMRLYLYEGSTSAVWTRRIDGDGLDAMAAEMVTNVSVSIGLALQTGEVRDMEPVDPTELEPEPEPTPEPQPEAIPEPEPVPEREPAPEPEPPPWLSRDGAPLWLRLSYIGNTFSSQMPWQSALGLRLTWKVRPRLALWARYAYVATQAVRLDGVGFDLRRHPITLGVGARLPVANRIDIAAGGAFSLDPVTRVLDASNPALDTADDGLRLYSSALAYAGVGIHVAPRVRLGLDAALDVLLTRADVVVRTGSTDTARHEADRVRLVLAAGLEIGFGRREKD